MKTPETCQELFLRQLRESGSAVTVYLVNGYQLRGAIADYDPFAVLLLSDGRQQLIYKHAISTITPAARPR